MPALAWSAPGAEPAAFGPDELLVTEFMVDPVASYDHHGQYIELFNGTSRVISLAGWQLSTDAAGYWLEGSPVLSPGERLLLCIDSDALLNGGLSCDLSWDGAYELANPDGLLLTAGETLVDEVHWAPLWGLVEGASLSLDPEAHDHLLNDDRSAWCSATTTMTSGDLGTPTTPNDPCP